MDWDTPYKCAIGTTAFFKRKCKKCGNMTVNSGLEFPRDTGEETKLIFKCFECGHKWKTREFERIDHAFIKYLNDFAEVIVLKYKDEDYMATVLDEDRILLMKPEKSKVVSYDKVSIAGGTLPVTMMGMTENLIGLEAIHKSGCKVNVMKCECGEYMVASRIEKAWWVHCKETFKCQSCGKKVERQRYGYRAPGVTEHDIVIIESEKSGKRTFAVDMGKGFLIYKNGTLRKVKRNKATIVS